MQRAMKPKRTNERRGSPKKGGWRSGLEGPGAGVLVRTTHPPQIRPQLTHRQRMRFQCTTAGTQSITFQNLMDAYLVATTATAVFEVFDAVKINFVEIWSAPVSFGAPLSIALEFNGGTTAGIVGDARAFSDTSMSSEPAHIKCRPSARGNVGMWNEASGNTAWTMTTGVNAIIDVDVSYRNLISAPALAANLAVAATPGQFYYRGLDGLAAAGTKYPAITVNADVI
jgi:hypothetical protein